MELMSFPRVHNPWHVFYPHDELYACEVYSRAITLRVKQHACTVACPYEAPPSQCVKYVLQMGKT